MCLEHPKGHHGEHCSVCIAIKSRLHLGMAKAGTSDRPAVRAATSIAPDEAPAASGGEHDEHLAISGGVIPALRYRKIVPPQACPFCHQAFAIRASAG